MAAHTTTARPYATALFHLARERGELAQWSAALSLLSVCVCDPALKSWLEHPRTTDADRVALLLDIVKAADSGVADTLTVGYGLNALKLLVENDRLAALPDIAALFEQHRQAEENTMDATLVAATGVDEQTTATIVAALESRLGRRVRLSMDIDPALLGGAIIRADDLVIDASLKSRLGKLAASLIR